MHTFLSWIINPRMVIILPVLLLIYIVGTSIDDILTKFGFETKTTLKMELVDLQHRYDLLKQENIDLKNLNLFKEQNKIVADAVDDWYNSKSTDIDKMINELDLGSISIQPSESSVEAQEEIKDTNELSSSAKNIYALNRAYNALYGA